MSFDETKENAKNAWEEELSRIKIEDDNIKQLIIELLKLKIQFLNPTYFHNKTSPNRFCYI